MGLFGSTPTASSPQDRVDLDALTSRVAILEVMVHQLQAQLMATPVPPTSAPSVAPGEAGSPAVVEPVPATGEPAFMVEVHGLVDQGKRINAIKVYREHTGVSLKDAKDAVERLP